MLGLSNSTASHAEPFEPGKARTGSFEGGNTGGRTLKALPHARFKMSARPSVQPPAGRNEGALIQRLGAHGKDKSAPGPRGAFREPRSEIEQDGRWITCSSLDERPHQVTPPLLSREL